MKNKAKAAESFRILRGAAHSAKSCWTIFLWLRSFNTAGHAYRMPLLLNELFFTAMGTSAQTQTVVQLHNLFNKHDHTHYLGYLIELCQECTDISSEDVIYCKQKLADVSAISKSVLILRHNIFAHTGRQTTPSEAFDKADLQLDETEKLFGVAFEILERLASCLGEAVYSQTMIESQVSGSLHDVMEHIREDIERLRNPDGNTTD